LSSTPIKHVLVIGAGTMGQQIGLQCAMHGLDVSLYDIDSEALQAALHTIGAYATGLAEAGALTAEQAQAAVARITITTDPAEAAAQADLISESVPEDPKLKAAVFRLFNTQCPPHTIFTTNTSSLVPSMIAEATGRPEQFAALHFHQPVWTANLVDVMPHPGTSAETLAQVEAFARQIGQIPIVLNKENYGYVFNAMYNALNREAITLAANGVATVEDIDRAWMVVMKVPAGPMGMLDIVGLETAWHITDYWANTLDDPQLKKNAAFLKEYVDKGWLGVKTGRGFYSYPDPAFAQPGFLEGES
jgi:3-hydroxybutyryl-CoA dehydrogenase